jgi:hypothetical protein
VGLRGLMVETEVEEVKLVEDEEFAKYSNLRTWNDYDVIQRKAK